MRSAKFAVKAENLLRARSVGMIMISDPRSLRWLCTKGTNESLSRGDVQVPLMHSDQSDLPSLTMKQIIPKIAPHPPPTHSDPQV